MKRRFQVSASEFASKQVECSGCSGDALLLALDEEKIDCWKVSRKSPDGRDWFFDHFIPADMHFFWCYRRAKQFELDLERFNHCQAHFDRVSERPSVVKVLELEKSVQAKFAS